MNKIDKEKIKILKFVKKELKKHIKQNTTSGICFIIDTYKCYRIYLSINNESSQKEIKKIEVISKAIQDLKMYISSKLVDYKNNRLLSLDHWASTNFYIEIGDERDASILRLRWVKAIIKALENNEEVKPDWN